MAAAPLPVFKAGGYSGIKPAVIVFGADNEVKQLTWSNWTPAGATGKGLQNFDNCRPDCADGSTTWVATTITLSQPANGQFTALTERDNGTATTDTLGTANWPSDAQP